MGTVKASLHSQTATIVYPCQGMPVPSAMQYPSATLVNIAGHLTPHQPKKQDEISDILYKHFLRGYQYRPAEATRAFEDNGIACDVAEVLLNTILDKPNILQKYFATGGGNIWGRFCYNLGSGLSMPVFQVLEDLWNLDLVQTSVHYLLTDANNKVLHDSLGNPLEIDFNAHGYFGCCSRTPLLALSVLYNKRCVPSHEDLIQRAYAICDDFNVNPDTCCTEEDFSFTHESQIQFSTLAEQVFIPNSIPNCSKGGGARYLLQKIVDSQGNTAFLPIRNVCRLGHSLTRPSYIRPDKPLFLYQNEIEKNDGRVLFLTSQLDFAASVPPDSDYIFTSAWRLKDYAAEEQHLNWTVFRGRTVYYLFISDRAHYEEEFELAMTVCNRIKQSGSGHPYIINIQKEN